MAIKEQNVIHRDLKLANLLVNFPTLKKEQFATAEFSIENFIKEFDIKSNITPFEIKITDLGFARQVEEHDLATTRLGTPLMMAPEILSGAKYDHSVDVWSLGCVFFEMLTGYPPFTGINQ